MTRLDQELDKTARVLVPRNWNNDRKGGFLEEVAGRLLKRQRYEITGRVRFTGMEIDLIADHIDTRERVFVECKFVTDPLSAGVINSLLGKALRKGVSTAYLFSTAPLGKEARGAIDELRRNPPPHAPRLAYVGPGDIAEMFADIYDAPPLLPEPTEQISIASASLIITPSLEPFWVLEEHRDGIPERALVQPVPGGGTPSFQAMVGVLKEHGMYEGLEFARWFTRWRRGGVSARVRPEEEVVTPVAVADSLDDYRPCRPQDFVGRYETQKQVWDFLERVRDDVTATRVLALSGPSGYGKSSVILKLADRFRNKKWANKFYLFPVDVRSARGPLFVAKALKTALERATQEGFVDVAGESIVIESAESLLRSASVQSALEGLRASRRVMVVFFDQFEELLTKDELLATFEAFRRLAFEIHAARPNLVVGFSWRSGITLSDDNPAYHLWHGLADLRVDILLDQFTSAESSRLVGQFERELGKKLLPPLRRRLLEQGQGLPWLLKKLCIHIYREIRGGTHQEELLSRRLNVNSLFEEDLDPLTDQQTQCLRFVAENSPADMTALFERFDRRTVNRLYDSRLIVRAGHKYAVYWDIFRDYLVEGTVPAIPWTYVPAAQFSMAMRALFMLRDQGPLTMSDLARALGYEESTVGNLVGDLRNLLLASRDHVGEYSVRDQLVDAGTEEIAEFVMQQLHEHVVIQAIYGALAPGQWMTADEFRAFIAKSYSAANLRRSTVIAYSNRLLPWFRFAGLLESYQERISRPTGRGHDFGKPVSVRGRREEGRPTFMCSAGPERVLSLARTLVEQGSLLRDEVVRQQARNAASDLVALGLAGRRGEHLWPTMTLLEASSASATGIHQIVGARALNSAFLRALGVLLDQHPGAHPVQIGARLGRRFGRSWSAGSALRYANAGRRWQRFFTPSTRRP
jgi:Holliday junction resolvase-like predicted endonuclease